MAVLARGGNAFDAAVAAGFVLQVVEPHLCGPGGEVPAVFVTASDPTPRVLCGQGVLPAAATRRAAARRARAVDRARHRAARGHRARGLGRLAHPAARPRHAAPGRRARTRARLRGRRVSRLVPRVPHDDRRGGRALPGALAELRGDLAAARPGAGRGAPAAGAGRDLDPVAGDRGRGRGEPGAAARRGPGRLVPRVRRRGDRDVLPDPGARRHRPRARRPAHRGRPGRLVGELRTRAGGRGRATAGRWPNPVPWSQGPVLAQQLALLDGDGALPGRRRHRGHRAPGDRGGQARLRRPRGLVRRQRSGAPVRPARPGLQRRAPRADHRHRVAGAAARLPRRARAAPAGPRPPVGRGARPARPAPASASRRSAGPGRSAGTRCTSTWSTRPAT